MRAARDDRDWALRPPDLDDAPELAALAVVRAAAEVVITALLAANPELTSGDDVPPLPMCALGARLVINDAVRIRRSIDHYRKLVDALAAADHPPPGDDDIPF